jgi:hypothetical protein
MLTLLRRITTLSIAERLRLWTRSHLVFIFASLLVGAALSACAATQQIAEQGLAMKTLPEYLADVSALGGELFWLDHESLLFTGQYRPEYTPSSHEDTPPNLYVWNTRSNAVRELARRVGEVCYFHGWVSYFVERDGIYFFREGPLGQETEIKLPPRGQQKRLVRFGCRALADDEGPGAGSKRSGQGGGLHTTDDDKTLQVWLATGGKFVTPISFKQQAVVFQQA